MKFLIICYFWSILILHQFTFSGAYRWLIYFWFFCILNNILQVGRAASLWSTGLSVWSSSQVQMFASVCQDWWKMCEIIKILVSSSLNNILELLQVNVSIIVLIHLMEHLLNLFSGQAAEQVSAHIKKLLQIYFTILVIVNVRKCFSNLRLRETFTPEIKYSFILIPLILIN